jgi:hypothetical protein
VHDITFIPIVYIHILAREWSNACGGSVLRPWMPALLQVAKIPCVYPFCVCISYVAEPNPAAKSPSFGRRGAERGRGLCDMQQKVESPEMK